MVGVHVREVSAFDLGYFSLLRILFLFLQYVVKVPLGSDLSVSKLRLFERRMTALSRERTLIASADAAKQASFLSNKVMDFAVSQAPRGILHCEFPAHPVVGVFIKHSN